MASVNNEGKELITINAVLENTLFIAGSGFILLTVLYLIGHYFRQKRLAEENKNLLLQQKLMDEHYEALQAHIEFTGKMRKDISQQLAALEKLLKPADKKEMILEYAAALKEELSSLGRPSYCDSIVVDSVLHNKMELCRKEGIAADLKITPFSSAWIREIDLLGILYNMFDNAIESCQKMELSRRFLELSNESDENRLILRMRNSMAEGSVAGGNFPSTKKDRAAHGLGLSIIRELAEKYGGRVEIHAENNVFEIIVCLKKQ